MIAFFLAAVAFTIGVSFVCSLLEALILSATVSEIESLKKTRPKLGLRLENHKTDMSNTISAILTMNTVANTAGSALVGGLATNIWGSSVMGVITGVLTLAILVFSEIIPKNLGVAYRVQLYPWVIGPLTVLRTALWPVTRLTDLSVRLVVKEEVKGEDDTSGEEEIILLAEKGAKEGTLTSSESNMIANALKLDDEMVSAIMTPRVVVTAIECTLTIDEVFEQYPNIPFARMPVYDGEIDNIVGLVRRRDLLKRLADDEEGMRISEIMNEIYFVPETVNVAAALQTILKKHQQLLVVVDEFGSMTGVITMEDIMEYILGREIFEKDDVAIDMRELARQENLKATKAYDKESEKSENAS